MKPLLLAILGSALTLTACSDNVEKTKSQEQLVTAPQATNNPPTKIVSQNQQATTKTINTESKPKEQKTTADNNIDTNKQVANANLQDELLLFTQSLDIISQQLAEKKQIIVQKEQQAKNVEDDNEIAKMTMDVLLQQKQLLETIILTEPQLISIRDKFIQSVDVLVEAYKDMIGTHKLTEAQQQKLVEKFTEGRKLSDEAKKELQALLQANK